MTLRWPVPAGQIMPKWVISKGSFEVKVFCCSGMSGLCWALGRWGVGAIAPLGYIQLILALIVAQNQR